MKYLCAVALILLAGCAEKRWVCYVDRNADSKCIKGDCIAMKESGLFAEMDRTKKKECSYGIMKIFPLKEAFVHANNPPTDIQKCREYADGKGK